jgi:hypothetical protein
MFGYIASFDDLKRESEIHKDILWDLEPKQLMEPKYRVTEEGKTEKKILRGYIFYIDKMAEDKPALFLMCHTTMGYAETVAKIDEISDDLIAEAVHENKDKEYFGMVPINGKIAGWLKKELGIKEQL